MKTLKKHIGLRNLTLVLIIAVLAFGGIRMTGAAAQAAIPGDTLYPVKTTIEQTRLSLAQDAGVRAQMKMSFAEQRLEEIAALIDEGRYREVNEAVLAFEADIHSAILELETIATGDPARASAIALEVTSALTRYAQTLSVMLTSAPENVKPEVTRALDTTQIASSLELQRTGPEDITDDNANINDDDNANINDDDNANINDDDNANINDDGGTNVNEAYDNANINDADNANINDADNANINDADNANINDADNANINDADNANINDADNANINDDDGGTNVNEAHDNANINADDDGNANNNDNGNGNPNQNSGDDNPDNKTGNENGGNSGHGGGSDDNSGRGGQGGGDRGSGDG